MIPDGFNADYATNYRWYKGEDAVWDKHLKGMYKTFSADEEDQEIKNSRNPANEINDILSDKVLIGWTSGAHTGVDIPVYAYGPQSERFVGLLENTDLPIIMAEVMKIELNN